MKDATEVHADVSGPRDQIATYVIDEYLMDELMEFLEQYSDIKDYLIPNEAMHLIIELQAVKARTTP